jgi:hypothetical protein
MSGGCEDPPSSSAETQRVKKASSRYPEDSFQIQKPPSKRKRVEDDENDSDIVECSQGISISEPLKSAESIIVFHWKYSVYFSSYSITFSLSYFIECIYRQLFVTC